jgi:hypothetical protein
MYFFLGWLLLSAIIGVVSFFREGYFFGPFMVSLLASPLAGFIYVTRLGFDQEDNLMA